MIVSNCGLAGILTYRSFLMSDIWFLGVKIDKIGAINQKDGFWNPQFWLNNDQIYEIMDEYAPNTCNLYTRPKKSAF